MLLRKETMESSQKFAVRFWESGNERVIGACFQDTEWQWIYLLAAIQIDQFYCLYQNTFVQQMNKEAPSTPRKLLNKLWSLRSPKSMHSSDQKSEDSGHKNVLNIILMGADCSGKSVFLEKDKSNKYEIMEPTLGACFSSKNVTFGSMVTELRIWDTNGQEKYRINLPIYIANDQVPKLGIIFYDVADRKSFDQVPQFYKIWTDKLGNTPQKNSIMLVANKIDYEYVGKNEVSSQEGLELAKKYNTLFVQSSSLFDVSHIFNKAVEFKYSQIGIRLPQNFKDVIPSVPHLNGNSRPTEHAKESTTGPISDDLNLSNEQKQKLIKLIFSLENLKAKVLSCKFQNVSNKYYKIFQFKMVWEQKLASLKTIQFCITKLKAQTTIGDQCRQQENIKSLQMLDHIRKNQLSELKKIQKVIVSYLPQQEEYKVKMEELREIVQAYSEYKQLAFSAQSILINTELINFSQRIENFDTFMELFVTYIQNLDNITKSLQEQVYPQPIPTESPSEANIIRDLITCYVTSRCKSSQDPLLSTFNPTETKEQRNISLQCSIKGDQQFAEENLGSVDEYLSKVRHIVEKIVRNDSEYKNEEKKIQDYNHEVIKKNWRLHRV